MTVYLQTEHNLELLILKRDCRGSPESTHVKLPHCWKSHVTAQFMLASDMASLTAFRSSGSDIDPAQSHTFVENHIMK